MPRRHDDEESRHGRKRRFSRSRSPRGHHADEAAHRHRRRHHRDRSASPATSHSLPFQARRLGKSDFGAFEALFAYYLEVQKQKDLGAMADREARGRWKSFVGKWNRGELAEGWYDPDMFAKCAGGGGSSMAQRTSMREEADGTKDEDEREGEEREEEDYGPALPHRRRLGARDATVQELVERDEAIREDRRAEVREDRKLQKERLEELVPRAEPGTRERRLEKKKEAGDKMRQFRDRSPGLEVGDGELMGGAGDELAELRKLKETEQKRKSERESRRELFDRARREEIEERRRAWQAREDGTVSMLKELAKQRFG